MRASTSLMLTDGLFSLQEPLYFLLMTSVQRGNVYCTLRGQTKEMEGPNEMTDTAYPKRAMPEPSDAVDDKHFDNADVVNFWSLRCQNSSQKLYFHSK